jgi:hypothetical protein
VLLVPQLMISLLLASLYSTISGILAIACLPSAVDCLSEDFFVNFDRHMSCWHPYCAVSVPADAISVVG